MNSSRTGGPSYRWLAVTLLVAVGVYAWYALGQYRRLNDLQQRQLSNAAAELKTSLETAQRTVAEFHNKWRAANAAGKPTVCEFDRSQPYLDLDECETVHWSEDLLVQSVTGPTLGVDAFKPPTSNQPAQASERIHFRFRTDLVLKELAFPDALELIFVATEDGVVLHEEAATQRQWLRYLRWGEQTFRDTNADRSPTLQVQNLREIFGGAEPWNRLRSVSSQASLELGGVSHQLYLQPLTLESSERRQNLIIGGAAPTSAVIRDALALKTGLVGVLVFLLLLCVLGFPFIKLVFLDPHERIRVRDISLLYLSSGSLLVLFTCASLAWDGHVRWRAAANAGLETLASDLAQSFRREVSAIRDQLVDYDATVGRWSMTDCDRGPVQTGWFAARDEQHEDGPWRLPLPTRPIQIRLAAWIRPDDGRQIWKATSDLIGGRTAVDDRFYFRAVRDGHLFRISGKGAPIFFGTDRSIVNGKFYAFVSMASALPRTYCAKAFDRAPVASVTAQLLSLDRQPLPAGYGFALVNREGRTLYHSDRRLSLRENLFEELSEGARARAMMYANHAGPLSSRYRERPHELFLQPIDLSRVDGGGPAGFYLVAFRDTSVERAAVGRVLVEGLSGPILLLWLIFALGLSGLSLASRLADTRWSTWLWPHGGLDDVYRWQAIALVGLLFVSVIVYRFSGGAIFLASPILASALGIGVYLFVGRHSGPRRRLSAPVWHAIAITLVLVCVVVVPSAALFRMALSYEFAKLISTERAWIEAQEVDAVREAEVEALEDHYALSRGDARAATRRAYFNRVPAPFDIAMPLNDTNSPDRHDGEGLGIQRAGTEVALSASLGWLDAVLPSEDAIASRQSGQTPQFTYSPNGTVLASLRASGGAFVGFGLMLGLLVWWIRWNTNRLFLADEDNVSSTVPSGPFDALWQARTSDEQMVLLHIAQERIANPYQRAVVRTLLRDGLVRLSPDLQPCSEEFGEFLQKKEHDIHAALLDWEQVNSGYSWRYVRLVLVAGVTCLGFFLIMTQPALQSSLLGIATGITGVLTTGLKAKDAIASWFEQRKGA